MVELGKIATAKVEGEYCDYCDELVAKITLKDDEGYMVCRECYQPTCKYCKDYVDKDGDFCCEDCIKSFKYDNKDKNE